ncbi:hypothetical protein BDV95DRAFT_245498 [Massariosphaeria phaeospora]|uniref:Uncharacterized protein n=1 Tax=Massariosphaeria phaeospora TaxID=100035 RepID=A0A7C8I0Q9_9PLEO|nr:hypothetical protein BDV95DRAFT_245498 [Massariosphaeria phaeospora]
MSVPSLKEKLDMIGTDIWHYDGSDLDFDLIFQTLSQLHSQLKVLEKLHAAAKLLQLSSFPKQEATRVKHFLKFVFERTTRGNNRHLAFRQLDCNALTFCGLTYRVKDIIELPQTRFEFLVKNVSDFVQRSRIGDSLYRDEINNMVSTKLSAEDEDLYGNFLKGTCACLWATMKDADDRLTSSHRPETEET